MVTSKGMPSEPMSEGTSFMGFDADRSETSTGTRPSGPGGGGGIAMFGIDVGAQASIKIVGATNAAAEMAVPHVAMNVRRFNYVILTRNMEPANSEHQ